MSGSILSQEEINALLMDVESNFGAAATEAASTEGQEPVPQPRIEKHKHLYKYDFRRPNKFSKELLRILKAIHDNMARLFSSSLAVYLRQDIKVVLSYIEQHSYQEYIDDTTEGSALYYIVSFINDQAMLSIDYNVALLLVEKLLGGEGKNTNSKRNEPTDIEMTILKNILDKLFHYQQESWGESMKDLPAIIATENNPRLIHLVQPNDIVLKMVFEVTIGEEVGVITYCIPYIVIEAVLEQMLATQHIRTKSNFIKRTDDMTLNIYDAAIDIKAELGVTEIDVEALMRLEPGDVIRLNTHRGTPLTMRVGDFEKFTGELGVTNKNYALKIDKIIYN